MSETDWATVAGLATVLGTLILAVATFSAEPALERRPARPQVNRGRGHRSQGITSSTG